MVGYGARQQPIPIGGVRRGRRGEADQRARAGIDDAAQGQPSRRFYGFERFQNARKTGAQLLWRVMSHVLLPREEQLADGSYLTRIHKNQNDQRAKRDGERLRGPRVPAR